MSRNLNVDSVDHWCEVELVVLTASAKIYIFCECQWRAGRWFFRKDKCWHFKRPAHCNWVKCSSSPLCRIKLGKKEHANKTSKSWSIVQRLIVKSCHIGPELMKWICITAQNGETGCATSSSSFTRCNKTSRPALPFTALISCCQRGGTCCTP